MRPLHVDKWYEFFLKIGYIHVKVSRSWGQFTMLLSSLQAKNISNKTEKWMIAKYMANIWKSLQSRLKIL